MTKKDFELIARVLKSADEVADQETIQSLAEMFADELAKENERFNRGLFIAKATATATQREQIMNLLSA